MKNIVGSVAWGSVATFAGMALSYAAHLLDLARLSRAFYWQGWWLQRFLACSNIGTPERPLCEGTPLNLVVFALGIPFGVVLYASIAYIVLSRCRGWIAAPH